MVQDAGTALVAYDEQGNLVEITDKLSLDLVRQTTQTGKAVRLTPQDKERLAESDKTFYITEVTKLEEVEHGEAWRVQATMEGRDGNPFSFFFFMGVHEATQTEYEYMHDACMQNIAIGPVMLELVQWKKGNPFFRLESAVINTDMPF